MKVQYFDCVLIFVHSVVNMNGTMLKPTDAGPFSDYLTHAGKPSKQIHVIKECITKSSGGLDIVLSYKVEDFVEVA
jgi:hypothetical protein